ncbi:hypothetical protein [Symmachiella dynata]|uniref:hypothetical protein n=1 Tax=Symmachiella dynata TaxID=2527995 RepID=UPI0018D2FCC3|nr:hypothetical protein [Symmachiella dynata]
MLPDIAKESTPSASFRSLRALGTTAWLLAFFSFELTRSMRRSSVLELLFLLVRKYRLKTFVDVGLQSSELARLFLVQIQRFGNRFGQYLARLRRSVLSLLSLLSLLSALTTRVVCLVLLLRRRTSTLTPVPARLILQSSR